MRAVRESGHLLLSVCLNIPVSFGEITPPPLLVVLVGLPVITAAPLVTRVSM